MVDYPDHQRGIRLVGTDITLDIRIEASDVDLNIIFTDQSVAVWGAAAWFARQGEQIFVNAQASIAANGEALLADRTVPGTKTFYVAGYAWGTNGYLAITGTHAFLLKDSTYVAHTAGPRGGSIIFDVPIRVDAGETLELHVGNVHSAAAGYQGGFWGWDEEVT